MSRPRPLPALLGLVALAGLFVAALLVLGSPRGARDVPAAPRATDSAGEPPRAAPSAPPTPAHEVESVPAPAAEPARSADTAEIRGRVVGAAPEVLATLEVVAEGEGGPPRSSRCGADGAFTLRELTPGARYRLRGVPAGKASFARARTHPLEVRAGAQDVELRYLAESALTFQVVDGRTGLALEDFEVRLGAGFVRPLLDDEGRVRRRFPEGRVRCTDLLESAADTALALLVSARGYAELYRTDLFVPEGGTLELGRLALEPAPRLVVHVLDEVTRAPIAGALVSLRPRTESNPTRPEPASYQAFDPGQGRTDAEGRVLLTSRPGAELVLRVQCAEYAPLERELALPLSDEHAETVRLTRAR